MSANSHGSSTPGRPLTYSGNNNKKKIHIITLFVDHISKKIFAEFQQTTSSNETLISKQNMEREAFNEGIKIKSFHTDNGVFKSQQFRDNLNELQQNITFSGVGAHHQNGIAERHIRIVIEQSLTQLLHARQQWKSTLNIELWTFSVRYSIDIWNNTPKENLHYQTPNQSFQI